MESIYGNNFKLLQYVIGECYEENNNVFVCDCIINEWCNYK